MPVLTVADSSKQMQQRRQWWLSLTWDELDVQVGSTLEGRGLLSVSDRRGIEALKMWLGVRGNETAENVCNVYTLNYR